jgi:hypothetical protein
MDDMYTVRELDDLRKGMEFATEHAAIKHAIKSGMQGLGVFLNDSEMIYIVDSGRVFAEIAYSIDEDETE